MNKEQIPNHFSSTNHYNPQLQEESTLIDSRHMFIWVNYSLIRQVLSVLANILNLSTPPKQFQQTMKLSWEYYEGVFLSSKCDRHSWDISQICDDIGVLFCLTHRQRKATTFNSQRIQSSDFQLLKDWK